MCCQFDYSANGKYCDVKGDRPDFGVGCKCLYLLIQIYVYRVNNAMSQTCQCAFVIIMLCC